MLSETIRGQKLIVGNFQDKPEKLLPISFSSRTFASMSTLSPVHPLVIATPSNHNNISHSASNKPVVTPLKHVKNVSVNRISKKSNTSLKKEEKLIELNLKLLTNNRKIKSRGFDVSSENLTESYTNKESDDLIDVSPVNTLTIDVNGKVEKDEKVTGPVEEILLNDDSIAVQSPINIEVKPNINKYQSRRRTTIISADVPQEVSLFSRNTEVNKGSKPTTISMFRKAEKGFKIILPSHMKKLAESGSVIGAKKVVAKVKNQHEDTNNSKMKTGVAISLPAIVKKQVM